MPSQSDKTCTISQMINRLKELLEKHGDLPIYADDADTDWRLTFGLQYREADIDNSEERIEIKTSYHGIPKGTWYLEGW